jgi:citrate synthase
MSGATSSPRGLDGVVAVRTRLSHVDDRNGVLIIAGYELKELAGRVTFEEAAYLLWMGRLPNPAETEMFLREIAALRSIPGGTIRVVREAANRGASPIDTLRMACSTLSLDVARPSDVSPDADVSTAKMLVARFPTIVAAHARAVAGQEPIAPRADLSLAANFLYMLNGKEPDSVVARALDTYWVTVIDHGMNASTSRRG